LSVLYFLVTDWCCNWFSLDYRSSCLGCATL